MTIDEMIAVLQAAKEGKVIETRTSLKSPWVSCDPNWNFDRYEYRRAPEPKEVWVNEYHEGKLYAYPSKTGADVAAGLERLACRHYREVIEE